MALLGAGGGGSSSIGHNVTRPATVADTVDKAFDFMRKIIDEKEAPSKIRGLAAACVPAFQVLVDLGERAPIVAPAFALLGLLVDTYKGEEKVHKRCVLFRSVQSVAEYHA
jgi:hypothetical protein